MSILTISNTGSLTVDKKMPYKRVGKKVYKKVDGWKLKGKSKSVAKAKSYLRTLQGLHAGWRPTRRK